MTSSGRCPATRRCSSCAEALCRWAQEGPTAGGAVRGPDAPFFVALGDRPGRSDWLPRIPAPGRSVGLRELSISTLIGRAVRPAQRRRVGAGGVRHVSPLPPAVALFPPSLSPPSSTPASGGVRASADADGSELAQWRAHYEGYCRAMRMLVEEGKSLNKIRRTVCWKRLEALHRSAPERYREPVGLYHQLQSTAANSCQGRTYRYVGES
jgi:hypothetical protein